MRRYPNTENYPILVVGNQTEGDEVNITNDWNGFELGGIARGAEIFDEFVHLMDTCYVHDYRLFVDMFSTDGSVHLCPKFFSYLGKYRTEILNKVGIPKIDNKEDAIRAEWEWNGRYLEADPLAKQFEPIVPITTKVFEHKHGRDNMVISNGLITKYKATYR